MSVQKRCEAWVAGISAENPATLNDLTHLLHHGLQIGFAEQPDHLRMRWAETASQTIRRDLDRYSGRSRFTTWAYKIAVRTAFDNLRKGASYDTRFSN